MTWCRHKFQREEESLKMKQAKKMMEVIVEECDGNESGIDSKLPSQSYQ